MGQRAGIGFWSHVHMAAGVSEVCYCSVYCDIWCMLIGALIAESCTVGCLQEFFCVCHQQMFLASLVASIPTTTNSPLHPLFPILPLPFHHFFFIATFCRAQYHHQSILVRPPCREIPRFVPYITVQMAGLFPVTVRWRAEKRSATTIPKI